MKMFSTIPEAIKICRDTYKDSVYVVVDTDTGEVLHGTAYDIYSEIFGREFFKGEDTNFWPIDDNLVEQWALMEVIYAISITRAPEFQFERDARNLLNDIVSHFED